MRTTRSTLLTAALALGLAGGTAQAQSAEEDLIRRGLHQREQGHDDEALALFRQAWELSRGARARAQMALAEQALGRWVEAAVHLREALAAEDPWIARNRAVLERARATIQQHVGALEVRCDVAGAAVRINDQPAGTTPLAAPVIVPAGRVTLDVRAPGYQPATRFVAVEPGASMREFVELAPIAPIAPIAPAAPAAPAAPPAPTAPLPPAARVLVRPPPHAASTGQRPLAWTAAAGAAALLGAGVVALVVRNDAAVRYNERDECAGIANTDTDAACLDALDTVSTAEPLAVAGMTVGAALAVTSVVLFVTAPPAQRERGPVARVGCGRGPGDLGLACAAVFE